MLEFIEITFIILIATISPGPDFMMVSRNALQHTQKAGVMTALGIALGSLLHSSYCILGFAFIISQSLILFNVIKYIGAIYLIYLGVKGLLEKTPSTESDNEKNIPGLKGIQAFQQGLFCTTLNPKGILFFLAFFTIIIKPSMPLSIQASYALEITLIDIIWFSAVAFFFSHHKIKMVLGKGLHYVSKLFGGLLILFGLVIFTIAK